MTAENTQPKRIRRRRGARLPDGAVDVTEGKWANPFVRGEPIPRDSDLWPYAAPLVPGGTGGFTSIKLLRAEDVAATYGWWFIEQPALMITVADELGGRDLACTCRAGVPCHGDFLISMANDDGDGCE